MRTIVIVIIDLQNNHHRNPVPSVNKLLAVQCHRGKTQKSWTQKKSMRAFSKSGHLVKDFPRRQFDWEWKKEVECWHDIWKVWRMRLCFPSRLLDGVLAFWATCCLTLPWRKNTPYHWPTLALYASVPNEHVPTAACTVLSWRIGSLEGAHSAPFGD